MKVLIACEESQAVTKEFRKLGHDAFSCDILPCSGGHPEWHYKDDAIKVLYAGGWDLVIAHPPCTYLCNSGVCWLYKNGQKNEERWEQMRQGAEFFKKFLDYPGLIAIENPIMHKYAVEIIGRRQDQVIQPWQFGHGETKATCLWLKGLPLLEPTNVVEGREQRLHRLPPSKDRANLRSKTYEGIAKAMATQWSDFLINNSTNNQ